MKQSTIINAYKVIQKHRQDQLPLDVSLAFFKVKKMLDDQWEFQLEKENELIEKYHPTRKENGDLVFDPPENMDKFIEEINAIGDLDIDLDYKKVDAKFGNKIELSVDEIEALEEFMNFE